MNASKYKAILEAFIQDYRDSADVDVTEVLDRYTKETIRQIENPTPFEPFHTRITSPFDYRQLGYDFIKPLIQLEQSTITGWDTWEEISKQTSSGENVILFANHQIEPDPQVLDFILKDRFPRLAEEMIFVAGDRVITDPLAIPFSLGCNLLCIFSKRYIDHPPEKREKKLSHNRLTMTKLFNLLREGGKCIYVAPSGGRDRKLKNGSIPVSPFDPQSIELFLILAKRSQKISHFYPLALSTHNLLPPPQTVDLELGEKRTTNQSPVRVAIGNAFNFSPYPTKETRAEAIWNEVCRLYGD